jgi:6-phosphogluconolactonase
MTQHWHTYDSVTALQIHVAEQIAVVANTCIAEKQQFHIVLAGGTTPQNIYALLRHCKTSWQHWHVYFGDERCYLKQADDRNDTMAFASLLSHVAIPHSQIHCIHAELAQKICVEQYAALLDHVKIFDLVLLGLGEDGHTASLFPGHYLGDDADAPAVLTVEHAPKEPAHRITLSAKRLSESERVWFLVNGEEKQAILQRWKQGETLPASAIKPANGIDIFTAV